MASSLPSPDPARTIGPGGSPGRSETEEQGSERGGAGSEDEDARVERKVEKNVEVGGQQPGTPPGDDNAGCGAHCREEQAFRKQLADEPAASGAERGADEDLATACCSAGEQQVGNIGAGDKQHHGCNRQEHHEGLAIPATDIRNAVAGGFGIESITEILRLLFGVSVAGNRGLKDFRRNDIQPARDLGRRSAGFGPTNQPQPPGNSIDIEQTGFGLYDPFGTERHHDIEGAADVDAREAPVRDAYDLDGMAVDGNGLADDRGGSTIFALPEAVAEHRASGTAAAVAGGRESAAQSGADSEGFEKLA